MQNQDNDKTIVGEFSLDLTYSLKSKNGDIVKIFEEIDVGRGTESGIYINDKKISRKHALLKVINDHLILEDLNSSNGTFLNGKKIDKEVTLKNSDVISFEKHEYTVIVEMQKSENEENIVQKETKNVVADKKVVQEEKPAVKSKNTVEIQAEDIPSSWVEEDKSIDGTKMMDLKQLDALKAGIAAPTNISEHNSDVSRIHCFIDGVEEIVELPITDMQAASGWEMGRDSSCDIVLSHPSVSNRHAQIIHQNGRWKIVNLVSTNGIMVNGQKKLSAYLGDGDKIGLGNVNIVFKTSNKKNGITSASEKSSGSSKVIPILLVLMALGGAAAYYYLNYMQ